MNEIAGVLGGRTIGVFAPSSARLEQLGTWFSANHASLLRFAYFVSGSREGAEDLVQDAFVRLYRAGARVDAATMPAYARRTISNLARSGFRRKAVAARHPADRGGVADPPDLGARDEMWRAILSLSPRQRAVVALRFYEDMSERDIAATLGMSVGSVKKHSDRAMTRLREILGRES
jgi:RNA polymerase sigma-70 factor (sigma-E family)